MTQSPNLPPYTSQLFGDVSTNSTFHAGHPQVRKGVHVKKQELLQAFLSGLAIISLFLPLWIGSLGVLAFLGSGLLFVLLRLGETINACRRCWPLFLFPAWGGITIFWANAPIDALKFDIQLVLTLVISISILSLRPLQETTIFLTVFFMLALLSVLTSSNTVVIFQTGEVVRTGVLGSKNNVSLFAASGLMANAMLFSQSGKKMSLNLLAGLATLVALLAMIQAKSLGTLVSATGCAGIGFFLWRLRDNLPGLKKRLFLLASLFVLIVGFLVIIVVTTSYEDYVDFMLSIGKDPTLTGRLTLWFTGFQVIENNFWGGVGLSSFWLPSNPSAVFLWLNGKREVGAHYGFHNLYIHYWVETGFLGMIIYAGIFIKLLWSSVWRAAKNMTGTEACAAAFSFFIVSKSILETTGFTPFSIITFVMCMVWILLHRTRKQ